MNNNSVTIDQGQNCTRVKLTCEHQNGLMYLVPADKSWVCSQENIAAHAIAGFMGDLVDLKDPVIMEIMQRWGLYFRRLPIDSDTNSNKPS